MVRKLNSSMIKLVSADGHITEWKIDDIARTVATTTTYAGEDNDGNPATNIIRNVVQLDRRGLAISSIDPLGNKTAVSYDSRDLEISKADPAGVRTVVRRNVFGEVISRTEDAGGKDITTQFTYDTNGNLLAVTDPIGRTTTWEYDFSKSAVARPLASGVS